MTNEEQIQLALCYKRCFSSETGLTVIKDLSKYCYEHRNTYVEGNHDKQNVNNGKRAVILYIRSKLDLNPNEKKQATAVKE